MQCVCRGNKTVGRRPMRLERGARHTKSPPGKVCASVRCARACDQAPVLRAPNTRWTVVLPRVASDVCRSAAQLALHCARLRRYARDLARQLRARRATGRAPGAHQPALFRLPTPPPPNTLTPGTRGFRTSGAEPRMVGELNSCAMLHTRGMSVPNYLPTPINAGFPK